jgi:hypothetical protein
MKVTVHPPTLATPPGNVAGRRVGAVVLAAVRAELLRLDAGAAGERNADDTAAGEDGGVDRTESAAGAEAEPPA